MTMRYVVLFSVNRSIPTFCHGLFGSSVVIRGSALFVRDSQQIIHLVTSSSIWLLTAGHQTDCLALALHFVIPRCPSCKRPRMSFCNVGGMTSLSPFSRSPSSTVRSPRTFQYGLYCAGTLCFSGHPSVQKPMICLQTSL